MMGRITFNPDHEAAGPCIRGMRFGSKDCLDLLAAGVARRDSHRYPDLEAKDIRAIARHAA